ncbi:FeoA family protein [Undibacterium fentianense]|uniref:Ferrous iron transport protein A n=1 Tax=Undibacterium fentianense TaxID=2828728 RepID=A0A941E070_9BURK|nr:ferrous iron transport protein A [Undibacterium fentianense]MBR7799955.1 ferrous iron transport protein A [Undibacterium fentianense]
MTTINDTTIIAAMSTNLSAASTCGRVSLSTNTKSLAEIAVGEYGTVSHLQAPDEMQEWATQLEDLGFIVGEPVTLMARGAFGGDPLVIRIGLSTFALRKAEAACVIVQVDSSMHDRPARVAA